MADESEWSSFVVHPRYGQGPRYTGSTPVEREARPGEPFVVLHWHSSPRSRIPGTAIEADVSTQAITTMGVTHYFDEVRTCRSCGSRFIFFAAEQKHWYEDLDFSLEADCVRCVGCRKELQTVARARRRYEELCHVTEPSSDEVFEMAACCLLLVEASIFSPRKAEHVRALLRRIPERRAEGLRKRLLAFEASLGGRP